MDHLKPYEIVYPKGQSEEEDWVAFTLTSFILQLYEPMDSLYFQGPYCMMCLQ